MMKSPPVKPGKFARFMATLAEQSGKLIKQHYSETGIEPESKSDGTVVTRTDREAEALMRELIRKTHPEHGIIGEEFGIDNPSAEFVWTLDPIDGTISYALGCPLFGTLVGLLYENSPILGCIHIPVLDQLCIGDGELTTVNGKAVRVRSTARLSDATLLTTDIASIYHTGHRERFSLLLERTRLFRTWGDCYGYLMVASGQADIMLDLSMKIWDVMPLIPIIRGAHGIISTWSGEDPVRATTCMATSPGLHPEVVEILDARKRND